MKVRLSFLILLFLLVLVPISAFAATWAKSYGGSGRDAARSIQQTSDGGFIVAGSTSSFGAGRYDFWVLKLDASGNVIWQKTYGGADWDQVNSIQQTSDGGFIVAGRTYSYGASDDIWVLKLDASGNVTWQKSYGGSDTELVGFIQETSDGGYIVVSRTGASDDIWVLKLDASGNVTWQKSYGGADWDYANSIQQTSDGGFIVAGDTSSFGAGGSDCWVLKLDSSGNIPGCNLIKDTFVVSANTIVIPASTSVTPYNTSATVTSTSVVPINTTASVVEQCFFAESSTDLSYAPVTPCRIVDTRLAVGAIPPGGIRSYYVRRDVAPQGGNPAGCPSPGDKEPFSVHINVTAVPVSGSGNIVAYPYGFVAPNASMVNYKTGAQNIANGGTIKTCFSCGKDINIQSNYGTTHVVIDVLGYYFDNPWH